MSGVVRLSSGASLRFLNHRSTRTPFNSTPHRRLPIEPYEGSPLSRPLMRLKKGGKNKAVAKGDLPTKTCVVCNRPFTW